MYKFVNELIEKVKIGKYKSKVDVVSAIYRRSDCSHAENNTLVMWLNTCLRDEDLLECLETFLKSDTIFIGRKVAKFEKVSYSKFYDAMKDTFNDLSDDSIEFMYDERVILPKRATKGSAGYDIVTPITISLKPGESMKIPTGIRCRMHPDWVLKVYPRSGLGFKYRAQLDNTVGIIDSDYYFSDNEGHIFIKITNDGKENKELVVHSGSAFCQAIFVEYGITIDDETEGIRNGGFGSTTK